VHTRPQRRIAQPTEWLKPGHGGMGSADRNHDTTQRGTEGGRLDRRAGRRTDQLPIRGVAVGFKDAAVERRQGGDARLSDS
jgi:hypothetical protein